MVVCGARFVDLGSKSALWFQITQQSRWCSFCQQPATTFWAGAYTNPPQQCQNDNNWVVILVISIVLPVLMLCVGLFVARQNTPAVAKPITTVAV